MFYHIQYFNNNAPLQITIYKSGHKNLGIKLSTVQRQDYSALLIAQDNFDLPKTFCTTLSSFNSQSSKPASLTFDVERSALLRDTNLDIFQAWHELKDLVEEFTWSLTYINHS